MDWAQLQAEHEACQEAMDKIKTKDDSPLNSLMFGIGQPLKVYWQNANFKVSRFESITPN